MIVKRTSRAEILGKLRKKINAQQPMFIASAASGLTAQLLEKAGVDCINTFSGARLRANGMGTMAMMWPILDSNQQVIDNTEQDILPAIQGDSAVIACINANDPLRDMVTLLNRFKSMGVFAVSNISPSISYVDKDSEIYRVMNKSGITFQHEVDALKLAREMDMVSVGLAFDMEDSIQLVDEARPDVFCFHAGTTKGGLKGYDSGEPLDETAQRTEEVYARVREIHPEIILIAHGAGLVTPEDGQYILDHTTGHGFWTGSSTERIPIERAIMETAQEFRSLHFRDRG